jgi:hypothetical protein
LAATKYTVEVYKAMSFRCQSSLERICTPHSGWTCLHWIIVVRIWNTNRRANFAFPSLSAVLHSLLEIQVWVPLIPLSSLGVWVAILIGRINSLHAPFRPFLLPFYSAPFIRRSHPLRSYSPFFLSSKPSLIHPSPFLPSRLYNLFSSVAFPC